MSKAPAFQFYVKDWLSDPQLKMASHSTKGIWIDMLCFMWGSDTKGEITGTRCQIKKMIGAEQADLDLFIQEGITLKFCDISVTDNENITVRNRRMFRDENDKKNNRERQARYRGKQKSNEEITPPSSSASASATTKKHKIPSASGDAGQTQASFILTKKKRRLNGNRYQGFMTFWCAFAYKKGLAEAADAWLDIPNYSEELIQNIIEAAKKEARQRPDLIAQGKTPKMAQGWLSGRRWEDEVGAEEIDTRWL